MITAIFLQRWKQLSRLQRNIITVVLGVTIFVVIYFISKQPSNVSQAYHGVIFSYICGTGLDWTFGGPVFNMLKISCFVVVSVCFCLIISFACIWVNMLWVQEDGDMYNYLDVCCVFFCNACATYCCFYVFWWTSISCLLLRLGLPNLLACPLFVCLVGVPFGWTGSV